MTRNADLVLEIMFDMNVEVLVLDITKNFELLPDLVKCEQRSTTGEVMALPRTRCHKDVRRVSVQRDVPFVLNMLL